MPRLQGQLLAILRGSLTDSHTPLKEMTLYARSFHREITSILVFQPRSFQKEEHYLSVSSHTDL